MYEDDIEAFFGDMLRDHTSEVAPSTHGWYCPLCSRKGGGVSLVAKQTKAKDRWFVSCSNFPVCQWASSPKQMGLHALGHSDVIAWDSITINKQSRALERLKSRKGTVMPAAQTTPDTNLQQAQQLLVAMNTLTDQLGRVQARLDKLEKKMEENEERRQKLGFEVF